MTWSEGITEQFTLVNRFTTDESDFYGPYNTLLVEFFPAREHYQVSPQFKRVAGSMGLSIFYIVSKRKIPVFFIEINTSLAVDDMSLRTEADDQMRKRFAQFASGSLPTPRLFGLSAMGTQFSVYELTTATNQLLPGRTVPNPMFITDMAPRAWWNYDLLTAAGEAKIRELVADVKQMAVDLNP